MAGESPVKRNRASSSRAPTGIAEAPEHSLRRFRIWAETEAMLRDFQRESGLPVRFAGLAEREAYAEAIAHEGRVNPGTARFALLGDERCGVTTGSARNCLLLDSASTRVVLADDDGLCRMARPPEAQDGLDLVSQNDPTQFWFYESRDALHRSLSFTDEVDLLGLHEELLGRPPQVMAKEHTIAGLVAALVQAGQAATAVD